MLKNVATVVAFVLVSINISSAQAEEAAVVEVCNQGRALCEEGSHEEAIDLMQAGYDQLNDPIILYFIARCHQVSGDYCRAIEYLQNYQQLASPPLITSEENITRDIRSFTDLCAETGLLDQAIHPDEPDPELPANPDPEPEDDPDPPPTPNPEPEPSRRPLIAGWVLSGIGLASLAVGTGCWADAWSNHVADPYSQSSTAFVGDGFGFGGAALVVAGVAMLIYYYTRHNAWRLRQSSDDELVEQTALAPFFTF